MTTFVLVDHALRHKTQYGPAANQTFCILHSSFCIPFGVALLAL